MSDLLERIKLSKYPSSVWLGKANGQEIIDLIEQLQQRIEELEAKLDIQTKRGDLATPAMDTAHDFKEMYDRELNRANQLAATVERLREQAYRKNANMEIKYGIDGSACKRITAWIDDVVGPQNLNAVKREHFTAGFMFSGEGFNGELYSDGWSKIVESFDAEIQTKYPINKE